VAAVVSSSGAYRLATGELSPAGLASRVAAPALSLHGTADTTVNVQQAHDFEAALRAAGKTVAAHYYDGAEHTTWIAQPLTENGSALERAIYADVLQRAVGFFTDTVR
jgi:dipeptidyl aminopeptidase/acylaminoacyl peptidase